MSQLSPAFLSQNLILLSLSLEMTSRGSSCIDAVPSSLFIGGFIDTSGSMFALTTASSAISVVSSLADSVSLIDKLTDFLPSLSFMVFPLLLIVCWSFLFYQHWRNRQL